ncbi:MAG: long-chain fatty acid--CoA ligase [Bacteroidales bacterium]|nr:long-chain fatty acid--CoA ligase [Bacteroidales bacterium]MCF8403561.1 long-chain fatty acid--CoA ligase [Bacteroidales bacterium]
MEVTRIFDILPYYKINFRPKDDALAGKEDGKWIKYSIDQYIENANNISYAFLNLGVKKGDKIATIMQNRPEWNFLDMGILQIGAVHVPIYPTISESDYKFILKHAEVKFVFVAGRELYSKIEHILPEVPSIKGIYTINHIDDVKNLDELISLGKANNAPDDLHKIERSIKAEDIATLIYTSGTTGDPKGVTLTHHNILSNVKACYGYFPVDDTCKCLSYLPVSHIYERTSLYIYSYIGVSIYYAESIGTIADNLKEIKAEMLTTVPRLLEKIFDKIMAKGRKLKGIKKSIFFWAVNLGLRYELNGKNGIFYDLQLKIANKLVFNKWRDALGGNMRAIVSGGAALQPRLARIFNAARIPTLEGYGLTETSPVIAVNNLEKGGLKFGTVGKPVFNVEVKIAEDDEILCKGPSVMKGYYKNIELTKEVIDADGWFHTGDLGRLEPEGHLKITGRKKALFKTAMGKYISPEHIENKLTESSFIDASLVIGENQKFAAALIVPDFTHLRSWCNVKGIKYATDEEMVKHPEIYARFKKEVNECNKDLGSFEQIKKFALMDKEWSIQTRELTANLKLRRNYICQKYKDTIEQIFK